jgi:hypothetical protein
MGGACSAHGGDRCIQNFNRKAWRKETLKRGLEVDRNIMWKTYFKEIQCEGVDWIQLARDKDRWRALVNTMMNLRLPYKAGNFLSSWATIRLSRRTLLHGVGSLSLYTYVNPVLSRSPTPVTCDLWRDHSQLLCWLISAAVAHSVSVTTDWTTGVRSPTEAEDFPSSLRVQTGSGAHPASCPMGTGGPFPGVKRGRCVMLTTHPHLVSRLRKSKTCTSSHPMCLHGV